MLKGLGRACAAIERKKAQLTAEAEKRVLSAAEEARDRARSRAPVDTGRLRDSIRAESDGLTARMATDCPYAAAVEFGTSKHSPRPFMRG